MVDRNDIEYRKTSGPKLVNILIALALLAGYESSFAQTAELDTTFGLGGMVVNYVRGIGTQYGTIYGMASQQGGKIIVAGSSEDNLGHWAFTVARYDTSGAIDKTFGPDGFVRTAINGGNGTNDLGKCVAVEPDGKIVVGGSSAGASGGAFAVARYDWDGTLDSTFGTDGTVRNNIAGGTNNDYGYAIAIQSNGKIVVAGQSKDASGCAIGVARYDTNGTLDKTFGTEGSVRTYIDSSGYGIYDGAYAVAIQNDGKIVVTGFHTNTSTGHSAIALVRYNVNGTLDSTFGTHGRVKTNIAGGTDNDYGYAVKLQADGKILVSGRSQDSSGYAFMVGRYDTNGTVDSTFGTNGFTTTSITGGNGSYDEGNCMAIEPDHKLIVAGFSEGDFGYAFAAAQYDSNGVPDGAVRTAINGGNGPDNKAFSVMVQPDGKILVGGYSNDQAGHETFALVRYDSISSALTSVQFSRTTTMTFSLSQNYPNPFNPTTRITYSLPSNSYVKLTVYNVLGQQVATLFSGQRRAGTYTATFNAASYASGVYFYRLRAGNYTSVKKMLLLK